MEREIDLDAIINASFGGGDFPCLMSLSNLSDSLNDLSQLITACTPPLVTAEKVFGSGMTYVPGLISTETIGTIPRMTNCSEEFVSCVLPISAYQASAMNNGCRKLQFEVTLETGGILQVGFSTRGKPWSGAEGVGDFKGSWGFDGCRKRLWNNRSETPFGDKWERGDILGVVIDFSMMNSEIESRKLRGNSGFFHTEDMLQTSVALIEFYINGMPTGSPVIINSHAGKIFPGISFSSGESATVNFGERPFLFNIPGTSPYLNFKDNQKYAVTARFCNGIEKMFAELKKQIGNGGKLDIDMLACAFFSISEQLVPQLDKYSLFALFVPMLCNLFSTKCYDYIEILFNCLFACFSDNVAFEEFNKAILGYGLTVWKSCPLGHLLSCVCPDTKTFLRSHIPDGVVPFSFPQNPLYVLDVAAYVMGKLPLEYTKGNYCRFVHGFLSFNPSRLEELQLIYPFVSWGCNVGNNPIISESLFAREGEFVQEMSDIVHLHQSSIFRFGLQAGILPGLLEIIAARSQGYTRTVRQTNLPELPFLLNVFFVGLRVLPTDSNPYKNFPPELVSCMDDEFRSAERFGGATEHLQMVLGRPTPVNEHPHMNDCRVINSLAYIFSSSVMLCFEIYRRQKVNIKQLLQTVSTLEDKIQDARMKFPDSPLLKELLRAQERAFAECVGQTRQASWFMDSYTSSGSLFFLLNFVTRISAVINDCMENKDRRVMSWVPCAYMNSAIVVFRFLNQAYRKVSILTYDDDKVRYGVNTFAEMLLKSVTDERIRVPNIIEPSQKMLQSMLNINYISSITLATPAFKEGLIPSIFRLANTDKKPQIVTQVCTLVALFSGFFFGEQRIPHDCVDHYINFLRNYSAEHKDLFDGLVDRIFEAMNSTISSFSETLENTLKAKNNPQYFVALFQKTFSFFSVNLALNMSLELISRVVPEFCFRNINVVRACEYIAFMFERFSKNGKESLLIREFMKIKQERLPPGTFANVIMDERTLVLPVIGICSGMWKHLGEKMLEMLSTNAGFSVCLLNEIKNDFYDSVMSNRTKEPRDDEYLFAELVMHANRRGDKSLQEACGLDLSDNDVCHDDELKNGICQICCAYPIDTIFRPCGHTSCHICIERQMINEKTCFFCRGAIEKLEPYHPSCEPDNASKRADDEMSDI